MSKSFRSRDLDQGWLLRASVHDFVPAAHAAPSSAIRCAKGWSRRHRDGGDYLGVGRRAQGPFFRWIVAARLPIWTA
jgi:hypothetical protein